MKDRLRFAGMRANRRSLSRVNNRRGTGMDQSRGRKVVLKSILKRGCEEFQTMDGKQGKLFNVGLNLCKLNKFL